MKSKKELLRLAGRKQQRKMSLRGDTRNIPQALALVYTKAACSITDYRQIVSRGGVPLTLIPSMCGVSSARVRYLVGQGKIEVACFNGMRFAIWTSLPSWWQYYPDKKPSCSQAHKQAGEGKPGREAPGFPSLSISNNCTENTE